MALLMGPVAPQQDSGGGRDLETPPNPPNPHNVPHSPGAVGYASLAHSAAPCGDATLVSQGGVIHVWVPVATLPGAGLPTTHSVRMPDPHELGRPVVCECVCACVWMVKSEGERR